MEGNNDGVTFGPSNESSERPVLKVPTADYGDELLFSGMQELQELWQQDQTMQGGLDMPAFFHNPASLFPKLVQEAMAKKRANESQLMQVLRDDHMSRLASQPEIDKCLWTVDEYVDHVTQRDMNPCGFIKDYFGEGGLCDKRVLEIRELIDKV